MRIGTKEMKKKRQKKRDMRVGCHIDHGPDENRKI